MSSFQLQLLTFGLASKVFEDRLINKGLVAEFRDFEAVYHLVIDAVDTYNERWEESFREQEQQQLSAGAEYADGHNNNPNAGNIGSRRMVFMSEKERKEELLLKQRAELAIKKGTAELNPVIEREIGLEVLEALEAELTKLLLADDERDIEGQIRSNLPISRKSIRESNVFSGMNNLL